MVQSKMEKTISSGETPIKRKYKKRAPAKKQAKQSLAGYQPLVEQFVSKAGRVQAPSETQFQYSRESWLAHVDEFNIAKIFPGKSSPQYVVNGHPIHVGSWAVHIHNVRDMPANTYTIVWSFPTCVAHNANWLSGFCITNPSNTSVSYNVATLLSQSESYVTTYGGDFISYSEGGYVWA